MLKALQSIFDYNVMSFGNGAMGAINGVRPDGTNDITSPQSEEFWVGITYSVGALMLYEVSIDCKQTCQLHVSLVITWI